MKIRILDIKELSIVSGGKSNKKQSASKTR
jgi:hypothetical protein